MINYRLKYKFYSFFFTLMLEVVSGTHVCEIENAESDRYHLTVSKYKILLLPYFSKTISSTYFCLSVYRENLSPNKMFGSPRKKVIYFS